VIRVVRPSAAPEVTAFLASPCARELFEEGLLPRTTALAPEPAGGGELVLEHERIPFPSFPYEWPAEMLHEAASLTLDLAERALNAGFGLKDATPYNILFRGPKPVFVDLLSFERREQGDPTWLPYAQFVRTFLLPLLCNTRHGVPLGQTTLAKRDGLEPEDVYRLLSPLDRLRPPFLTLVSIPKWLGRGLNGRGGDIYRRASLSSGDQARFVLRSLFRSLRRSLRRAAQAPGRTSPWSSYARGGSTYSDTQLTAKEDFVREVLSETHPKNVLDVGCNTGRYSAVAAACGASVVAIDQDPVVVGETWRMARDGGLDILPLVVDLCRPSPATGWLNRECPSFLERASGGFDAVLMLAVLHHMLVTERVPLDLILDLAAELTTEVLVIEFVPPEDPMFRLLLRGREELHQDLTQETFEAACRKRFVLVRSLRLEGSGRVLYAWRKHEGRPR
jgi:SAM-dependent methyltransferase